MKKFVTGLLIAATMLTPIASAAAQDRGDRSERSSRSERGDQRATERSRVYTDSRPDQRNYRPQQDRARAEQRAQQERARGSSDYRRNAERQRDSRDNSRWDNRRPGDYRTDNRSNNRNWSRDWRSDRRYDYRDYRVRNQQAYRMPRYQAPYRDHRYSRFQIGRSLNSSFYNQRYWISNPGHYRLPNAYGNYRWVRYYDDAMLIDVRRGTVVDVLHDFFW